MKRALNFSRIILCWVFFAATSSAYAGWYEIGNYIGVIGNLPIHLSLQTYDDVDRGAPGQWRLDVVARP